MKLYLIVSAVCLYIFLNEKCCVHATRKSKKRAANNPVNLMEPQSRGVDGVGGDPGGFGSPDSFGSPGGFGVPGGPGGGGGGGHGGRGGRGGPAPPQINSLATGQTRKRGRGNRGISGNPQQGQYGGMPGMQGGIPGVPGVQHAMQNGIGTEEIMQLGGNGNKKLTKGQKKRQQVARAYMEGKQHGKEEMRTGITIPSPYESTTYMHTTETRHLSSSSQPQTTSHSRSGTVHVQGAANSYDSHINPYEAISPNIHRRGGDGGGASMSNVDAMTFPVPQHYPHSMGVDQAHHPHNMRQGRTQFSAMQTTSSTESMPPRFQPFQTAQYSMEPSFDTTRQLHRTDEEESTTDSISPQDSVTVVGGTGAQGQRTMVQTTKHVVKTVASNGAEQIAQPGHPGYSGQPGYSGHPLENMTLVRRTSTSARTK